MSAQIELKAAQALYAARLFEAAVHDPGPWVIRWETDAGSLEMPAVREITDEGVTFHAEFPEICWLTKTDGHLILLRNGAVDAIRAIDHPGDTAFVVTWRLISDRVGV